jgi:hypothetical protein
MKTQKKQSLYKLKKVGIICLTALSVASCKKALDINVDPNSPSQVSIKDLLPSAEVNLGYTLGGEGSRIPGSIVQYYAGHRGQPLNYAQYNIQSADLDYLWSNMYAGVLRDLKTIIDKGTAENDLVDAGAAQILSAYSYSVLTDMFGDIPFSQSLNGLNGLTPAYDKQEAIYPALITLIDQGITNLKSGKGGATTPLINDVIFGGDINKWEQFGNSLKLRLYNHLSKVQPTAALTFLNTTPKLITINKDNAAVVFGTSQANANPIYQFDVLSGRLDNAMANTLVDRIKALNDPRITPYFFPIEENTNGKQGQILGNQPGVDDDDSGMSKFSREGSAYAATDAPVMLMSAAEVQFIIAEVQLRATNNAAAATAYNAAIDRDFEFLGLGSSATYRAQSAVAFNNTTERLIGQKWITMLQAPFESWVDYRRTGFPALKAATPNRTGGVIPRKAPYPQVEINLNRQSLEAGPGFPVPFETLKQRVWWDRQ